jgi:hypothetical protein
VTIREDSVPDDRPRVPLAGKRIDLAQLAGEVGTPLVASDTEVVVADEDTTVTAAALQAALDAHVPATTPDADADLAARIQAVHDDPNVSASVKKLTAALLGLNGEAAVAGRPTDSR